MNTTVELGDKLTNEAKKVFKAYAGNEKSGNEHIVKMASIASRVWDKMGRKSGAEVVRKFARDEGVARDIDSNTQALFIRFAFALKHNSGIATIGENKWSKILRRVVNVDTTGKATWMMLLDSTTGEPMRKADANGFMVDTGETTQEHFKAISDFTTFEGDVLENTFPTSAVKQATARAKIAASQGGIAKLQGNVITAIDGKPSADAEKALRNYFTDASPSVLLLLQKVAGDLLKSKASKPTPPEPVASEVESTVNETVTV